MTSGSRTGSVGFDEKLLILAPPPAAKPQPGANPRPGQPGAQPQLQPGQMPPRQPRPRVVPPPVPTPASRPTHSKHRAPGPARRSLIHRFSSRHPPSLSMSFQRSLVFLLLGWVTASAQQPAEAPPAAVTPPHLPCPHPPCPRRLPVSRSPVLPRRPQPALRQPDLRPPRPKPGIPLGENKIVEDIIEPKLTGNALAGLYRKYTGRRVIVTAGAATAEMSLCPGSQPAGSAHLRRGRRAAPQGRCP